MKTRFFYLLIFLLCFGNLSGQKISGRSAIGSLHINRKVEQPPDLQLVESSVQLHDANNNQAIDANEELTISFSIQNLGKGTAHAIRLLVEEQNGVSNLYFSKEQQLGTLLSDAQMEIKIPIGSNINLRKGKARFKIQVLENKGFDMSPLFLSIDLKEFAKPNIALADFSVIATNGTTIKRKQAFDLSILLQNKGLGKAEEVSVSLQVPEAVFCLSENQKEFIGTLEVNNSKKLNYSLIANSRFKNDSLKLDFHITEKYGKYASDFSIKLAINRSNSNHLISFENVEVDKNIPDKEKKYPYRFALIIGNEDYGSYQLGLNSETNVEFAQNDAQIFAQYAEKVLGVEHRNVHLLINATSAQMKRSIQIISKIASKLGQDAELIVYYAGHGLPSENDKTPYLIPVDVGAGDLAQAVSLHELYKQLSATRAGRITVFIDACFSGGGRESGLLAARTVKIKPRKGSLKGNIVVFAASSGKQSALAYRNKKHGMFTYFLLKKLQETAKKQLTYKELADYISKNVGIESLRSNRKEQDPQVNVSQQVKSSWQKWKID